MSNTVFATPRRIGVVTPTAAFFNIGQDVKETTNGSGSQSAAESSACNTYRPQAECRTRPCWRAQHPACGYVWALSEDEELPLACLGPTFPGLSSAFG